MVHRFWQLNDGICCLPQDQRGSGRLQLIMKHGSLGAGKMTPARVTWGHAFWNPQASVAGGDGSSLPEASPTTTHPPLCVPDPAGTGNLLSRERPIGTSTALRTGS